MATIQPISIEGLRDLQAALRGLDGEAQKQLRLVLNGAAATVAHAAARRVPTRTGKARGSIRPASSQREARVKAGGSKAAYYGWLDFGGAVGRKKNTRRRFLREGRYMYPAFHANRDSIYNGLQKSLTDMLQSAGLEVSRGG